MVVSGLLMTIVLAGQTLLVFAAQDWMHFNYDPLDAAQGPAHWGADCVSEVRQSPINIVTKDVKYGQSFSLAYQNVDQPVEGVLVNSGHSTSFKLTDSKTVLTVSDLPGFGGQTFGLSSFHIHFGNSNDEGSEHQMDGDSYPAEIHFVHVNTKYSTLTEALGQSDGLAVVGMFLRLSILPNYEISKLMDQMVNIQTKESSVPLTVTLSNLLPPLDNLYTYAGSLTTPPCSEVVQWFVAQKTMGIKRAQLAKLRMLRTGDQSSEFISKFGNFRPIQPMSGRVVSANFKNSLWNKLALFLSEQI